MSEPRVEFTEEAIKRIGNNAVAIDVVDGKLVVLSSKEPSANLLKTTDHSGEDPRITLIKNTEVKGANPFYQMAGKYKTLMSTEQWEHLIDEDGE
ncbi:hypothetical protein [Endozoicomonas sp. ONNA1]|uniref:hypothetical protein n=1 Tax=Endozoicomonas sp. ONNA1 TaxID=2828740 RepID=UPI0021473040|nr:hypothetical protein [Endozoicomonas sp. ONNA1]